jgi:hypothetical protein
MQSSEDGAGIQIALQSKLFSLDGATSLIAVKPRYKEDGK